MKRGPKNLQINFSSKNLTHFGGLYLLQKFFQKIGLRSLLSQYMNFLQRNNRYSATEEMLALIYPVALRLGRIETSHLLKENGVFQYLTGLPTYPNPTTLRRFLLRMAPLALPKLRKLHDRLLLSMIVRPNPPPRVIFDLDSTVLTLYGKQEMARIGYNPQKWGRPSYHPLLCFNGITKDFWYGELRPGDTHTAAGTVELLEAVFAKLPPSVKTVIIRADKGFYDHETIEYLESRKALFVIVAKLTAPVKRTISTHLGVHVSTHKMEKRISFCGSQASHPRRSYGTTYAFLNGQIQLSGYCDQYETDPSPYLEILQRSGRRRVDYQRTQRGLPFGKNPDKVFRGQRGLLPCPSVFLQPNQLVQAIVPTDGVPTHDA
jgi:hypothetical protein